MDIKKEELEKQVVESQEVETQEVESQNFEIQEVETQELESKKLEKQQFTVEENKKYGVFDLLKLSGKLIGQNKKKFGIFCLQLLLFSVVYFGLVMVIGLMADTNLMQSSSISSGITTVYDSVMIVFFVLMWIITMLLFNFIFWLTTRTVSGIDTGIESIELKKVNTPRASSFFKMILVQFLIVVIFGLAVGLLSLLMLVGDVGVAVFVWLFPQIMIVGVLVSYYMIFATFEVICKNKSISAALTNARINLFYSKNGIILKMLGGGFLITAISMAAWFLLAMLSMMLMMLPTAVGLYWLSTIFSMGYSIVYFILSMLVSFFMLMYRYLVYMLNEVRDDKVENLR